ncbi:CHAT domain-containing protein [Rhizoctonia solani]|nr:CHAT domain-containing protein [Rhizoctonia solani]
MDTASDIPTAENGSRSFDLFRQGTELWTSFLSSGSMNDLDKGIEYLFESISLLPDGDSRIPGRLDCLCSSCFARFECLGNLEDLNNAIEHETRAYGLTPEGDPDLPTRLGNLLTFHQYRFDHQGKQDDLSKSIDYATRAHSLNSEGHSDLPQSSTDLGNALMLRFRHLGNMEDLNTAMDYYTQAYTLTSRLGNLSTSYFDRYMSLGNLSDLEMSIQYEIQAHSLIPEGDPVVAEPLSGLCVCYGQRFQRLRELSDADRAIDYGIQSCSLTPPGDPALTERLRYLGIAYHERFLHAYEFASQDFSQLPQLLCSLGSSYHRRFIEIEDSRIDDVDRAIQYQEQAKSLYTKNHPDFHRCLSRLGSSYYSRFMRLNDIDDLNKSIENSFQAHSLTPIGDPSLAWQLSNIGSLFYSKFERSGSFDDLNNATEYHKRAYKATPERDPDFTLILRFLGICYEQRFQLLHDEASLNSALDYFRQGTYSIGYPNSRIEAALSLAGISAENGLPDHLDAYQTAIELIPEVIWVGITVDNRYKTLAKLSNIAVEAASAAIASAQPELALEWLEQGQSIVWNQTLLLRSPLDDLRKDFPALAKKLEKLGSELYYASSRRDSDFQEFAPKLATPEQVAQQHHQIAKEYADQISYVRGLPGFSNFMKPKKFIDLVPAARAGPVVVINCHESRCDALIISPGVSQVAHATLPFFTNKDARRLRAGLEKLLNGDHMRQRGILLRWKSTEKQISFKQILATLWNRVVHPVLMLLQYKAQTDVEKLPRITWCTTGDLSFLPLHAAGVYETPTTSVSDYAISSYAPTFTALLNCAPSSHREHSSLLTIGQHATPGHTPLPGTQEELAHIQKYIHTTIQHTQLVGHAATTEAVLSAMERHDWVHLACHASQNARNPTQSGLFLHDDVLDLMAIMTKSFKNKGLAFLSACQTAKGDENLPEEAVHLASGLLTAGYTSVIASMWAVGDRDAPLVADRVYNHLLKDGRMDTREAAKALHLAVIELRERIGVDKYSHWTQYIHIGS